MSAQANKHRQKNLSPRFILTYCISSKWSNTAIVSFVNFFWWGQLPIMILDEKALELNRLHKERKNYIEMANTTSYKIQI